MAKQNTGADRGRQKGAQQHAEGQHGPKAHERLQAELRSGESGDERTTHDARGAHDEEGKHRLFERREQNDPAERASEKNRLDKDIQDHDHNRENFQVRGGSASSRAMPRNPINPQEPDAPTPGREQPPPPQRVPGVGGS